MPDSDMTREALRLRSAVEACDPDWRCRPPADEAAIGRLREAFAPLHPPTELLDLLRVMNGEIRGRWALVDNPPLLGCDQIIAETESRTLVSVEVGDLAWCPAWAVITSGGWNFDAVLAEPAPLERSAVLDLSYGGQDYMVTSSSLTSLVASSAEIWERGLCPVIDYQAPGWQAKGRAQYLAIRDVRARVDGRYQGTHGWLKGDGVTGWSGGWPIGWPRGDAADDWLQPELKQLADVGPGREERVQVTVGDGRGRYRFVHESDTGVWAELAPGHEEGRSLDVGTTAVMTFQRVGENEPAFARAQETLGRLPKLLRVTGIFTPADQLAG